MHIPMLPVIYSETRGYAGVYIIMQKNFWMVHSFSKSDLNMLLLFFLLSVFYTA